MHKQLFYLILLGSILTTSVVLGAVRDKGGDNMALGAYTGGGMSFVAGNGYEQYNDNLGYYDQKPKFSGEGGAYFDYYFRPAVGIETGMGFIGKGIRFVDGDDYNLSRIVYFEVPVLAKLDIFNFRMAAGLAFWFAVSGKTEYKNGPTTTTTDWEEYQWDWVHRVNLGPKVYMGYAIPVGPVFLVPHVTFRMHLINDLNRDEVLKDFSMANEDELKMRFITVNFDLAVEYTF